MRPRRRKFSLFTWKILTHGKCYKGWKRHRMTENRTISLHHVTHHNWSPITVLCFYCWMCKSKWETSVSWKLYYRKVWIERLLCFRIGFFLESHVTLHNWSRDAFYLPHYCLSSFKRQEAKIQLFPHRIVHFLLGLYKCYSSASFSCCRIEGLDKKPA